MKTLNFFLLVVNHLEVFVRAWVIVKLRIRDDTNINTEEEARLESVRVLATKKVIHRRRSAFYFIFFFFSLMMMMEILADVNMSLL